LKLLQKNHCWIETKHDRNRPYTVKGCTRLAVSCDKVYQLLAHGRWFSPGTPPSSTTKTGRHDIAEIVLKVALNTKNKSIIDHGHAAGKLYYLRLRVECTLFCYLQNRVRTHAVLVIGLYELLGKPTT
jgi:hypothetical protein